MKVDIGLDKALDYCLKTFGKEAQLIKAIEELSELIQILAVDLLQESSIDREEKIAKELADVKIMVQQLDLVYPYLNEEMYNKKRLELILKTKSKIPWRCSDDGD
ncbi:hypothetical protein [uncultured Methanobacterium sp.]|uniref:hypothetical protein n=1 Tax=uncultured Methanobacterium sp. TaxID=176306 RepID=UPI002AA7EDCA|nr:hypothetical protein [uncultured Methanobacterium sp.]